MKIRFWGVRGSIASPGPATARVGGNTSCVEVSCGTTRLILDAGTGIRTLGARLAARGELNVKLLLSHYHWDHIQGLPFFAPAFLSSARLEVYGPERLRPIGEVLRTQMASPVFPVAFEDLTSSWRMHPVEGGETFNLGAVQVRTTALDHPGGSLAYRIDHAGRSVVYATDTESEQPDAALIELARGADLLIYDSQYTPEEYRGANGTSKAGWGHSTYVSGCALAAAAGVGRYALFHHDPLRTDVEVASLAARARSLFAGAFAAIEGRTIELDPVGPGRSKSLSGHRMWI